MLSLVVSSIADILHTQTILLLSTLNLSPQSTCLPALAPTAVAPLAAATVVALLAA
jgi:hypothetical protein